MQPGLKKNVIGTLTFVGLIWLVYIINTLIMIPGTWFGTGWDLTKWGLAPRTMSGLIGIMTMPFLHGGIQHLLANTVPLTVLLIMLATTRTGARRIVVCLIVLSGSLLWMFGFSSKQVHVGCSGLVYALAAYLIAAGFIERKVKSAVAAILVAVLYGSLFWGLFPTAGEHVSWDGHLFAAIAGAGFAVLTLRTRSNTATSPAAT